MKVSLKMTDKDDAKNTNPGSSRRRKKVILKRNDWRMS